MSTAQTPLPPVVDAETWQRELDELRVREKAATRELDAIAAQRRRLPMVRMPECFSSMAPRIAAVSGATVRDRPRPITIIAGSTCHQ